MNSTPQVWKVRLAAACCAGLFAAPSAFAVTTLTAAATTTPVVAGSPLLVNVSLADVIDLYGYQFSLSFNPAVLQATGVSTGAFLPGGGATFFGAGTINNTLGKVSFVFDTLLGPIPGVSGSGVLASIGFNAVQAGTSSLSFSDVLIVNSASATLSVQALNGAVTVVPEPAAAMMLALGLAGLALRRRTAG